MGGRNRNTVQEGDDPLWYKDAILYELHMRAFADSTEDGVGDFRGLTQKLAYLQDLGITALWLLPFVLHKTPPLIDLGGLNPANFHRTCVRATSLDHRFVHRGEDARFFFNHPLQGWGD